MLRNSRLLAVWSIVWAAGFVTGARAAEPLPASAVPPSARREAGGRANPSATRTPAGAAARPIDPARQKLLQSPEWRSIRHAFREWLSVHRVYSSVDARRLQSELDRQIVELPAAELPDFLADWKEKMQVADSREAENAWAWLSLRLDAEAHPSARELQELRPDIVRMTAAQLRQLIQRIELERARVRQTERAFAIGRRQQVQDVERTLQRDQRERDQALNRAWQDLGIGGALGGAAGGAFGNYYTPGTPGNVPTPFPFYPGGPRLDSDYGY